MASRKTNRLRKLRVDRIDLVDAGAQPDALIPLAKRRDDTREEPDVRGVYVKKLADPASIDAYIYAVREAFRTHCGYSSPEGCWWYVDAVFDDHVIVCAESMGTLYRCAYATSGEPGAWVFTFETPEMVTISYITKTAPDPEDPPMPSTDELIAALPDEVRKAVADAAVAEEVAKAEALQAQVDTLTAELADAKADEPAADDVMKGLPEEVRKRITDAEAKADEAAVAIEKMRDERDLDAAIAKARSDYPTLGEATEIGTVLHRIAKTASPEDVATLDRIFKAASAQVDTTELFKSIGHGAPLGGELETLIAKHRAAGLGQAEAVVAALDERPDLYTAKA